MKIKIQYAHCVRFSGSLDCYPLSQYELRSVEVDTYMEENPECDCCDWYVTKNGKIIACEETLDNAIASAKYLLMDQSRRHAVDENATRT